jgi:hypothetical protein
MAFDTRQNQRRQRMLRQSVRERRNARLRDIISIGHKLSVGVVEQRPKPFTR